MDPVISISGLTKSYGDKQAVRGIDLEVRSREVLAVLGPNGAGKTTTVEILEGYRDRSGGEVTVLGVDPAKGTREWRGRLGIVPQDTALQPYLTVRESLELYAGYFPAPKPVDEVVGLVGLEGQEDVRAGKLSGGQKRRLDVAIALVGDPELLFLDEPTTGFDPSARRQAWDMVSGLRDLGKTIVLTTHYMDEAQALADRVAIIRDGRIVALDRPEDLGGREQLPTRISFRTTVGVDALAEAGLGELRTIEEGGVEKLVAETTDPVTALNQLTGWVIENRIELDDLEVRRPTLEDVYLRITGADTAEPDSSAATETPSRGRRRRRRR